MINNVYGVRVDINAIKTGDNIYNFRVKKGLTQAKLAGFIGVSTKTISNWEQGHKSLTIEHLATLSHVLGVKTDDILCYTAEDVVLSRSNIIVPKIFSTL